jgi:hypothetical protein
VLIDRLKKSGMGLIIAVLVTCSFDHSSSWLTSAPPLFIPTNVKNVNKPALSEIRSEQIIPTSQNTATEAIPEDDLVISTFAPERKHTWIRLKDTDTLTQTVSAWHGYAIDPATDICQPPDSNSPLCAALLIPDTSSNQNLSANILRTIETDLQQVPSPYTANYPNTFFLPPLTTSPLVEAIISQVDQEQLVNYVAELSGAKPFEFHGETVTINSRYSFSDQFHLAAEYLYHYYLDQGLDVAYHDFNLQGTTLSNVIAEKPGSVFPEQIYLLTAHYDSLPAAEVSPGADDNASGVAGVMMAAQILSQYDFGCTLRFVNFAAEEQDLTGSQHYAHQSFCSQEDMRAVLNLDMIAWTTPGSSPDMDLHANINVPGSVELAEFYQEVIGLYGLDLKPEVIKNGTQRSDHASFWDYGMASILIIEDFYPLSTSDFNPYYHTQQDTLNNLRDTQFFTNMVKAAVASLAHLGCLVEEGRGEVVGFLYDRETGSPIAGASVTFHNPLWGYTHSTRSGEDGYFHHSLVSGIHQMVIIAPGYAAEYYENLFIEKDVIHSLNFTLEYIYDSSIYLPLLKNLTKTENPMCP